MDLQYKTVHKNEAKPQAHTASLKNPSQYLKERQEERHANLRNGTCSRREKSLKYSEMTGWHPYDTGKQSQARIYHGSHMLSRRHRPQMLSAEPLLLEKHRQVPGASGRSLPAH